MTKTNAMRLLEQAGLEFTAAEYEYDENDLDGRHVADQLGLPYGQVFKTLVAKNQKNELFVFCIPVDSGLDLKKAAHAAHSKSIEMLHVRDLLPSTGYIRGGCSPIGMKKKYPTCIDESAVLYDKIAFSAGMRGEQIMMSGEALAEFIGAEFADLTDYSPATPSSR